MGQLQELEKKEAEVALGQATKLIEGNGYGRSIKKTHKTGFLVDSLKELEEQVYMIMLVRRECQLRYRAFGLNYEMGSEGGEEALFRGLEVF